MALVSAECPELLLESVVLSAHVPGGTWHIAGAGSVARHSLIYRADNEAEPGSSRVPVSR